MTIRMTEPAVFGSWTPDEGDFMNSGALVALNCVSEGANYKPFAEPSEGSDALPAACKGGFAYRDASGNATIFAGTKTKLYVLDGTSWNDVTRLSGGDYTMGDDNFWQFLNFGNLVIATNYTDDIQVYEVGVSTNFEQLSATAPRCRNFYIQDNFLMCLDTSDGDGDIGFRVRWSPLGDPQGDWTDDPTGTQADYQDIYGGDYANAFGAALQGFGVIVQGKNLIRVDYVGGDKIFSFTKIDTGRGSILPRSCISNGRSVFFLSEDDFYEYTGNELIALGHMKVAKTFYQMFDETYDYNLNTAIDPLRKNVLWAFPTEDASSGLPDRILCFNWVDRRFTLIEQESEILFNFLTVGYTMDGLDAIYSSVDDIPYSLDSRIWTGGKTVLGCFTGNHKLAAFSGDPKTATIGTTELRINNSGRATIHNILPYVEGGDQRVRLGRRNRISETEEWTDWVDANPFTGEFDFLHDATLFRAEIEISGSWSIAKSVAFRAKATGGA